MRYVRVKVDFSPNKTLNLLKAVVFLLLGQRYETLSHIILELLPLSLPLKKRINSLASLSFVYMQSISVKCILIFE